MIKVLVGLFAGMFVITANAGGLVQVLDNEVDNALMYVDLDSVTGAKNQVIGGEIGELYVSALMRIDILEGSSLKTPEDIHHVIQKWVMSCNDNSYYKLTSSSYGANHKFVSSSRMGEDIPLKVDFTPSAQGNETQRAVLLATQLACGKYMADNKEPHFIKYQ